MTKPKVAITIGDPAGIGPEITYRAINSLKVQRVCSPVVFGDKKILDSYFKKNKAKAEFIYSSDFNAEIKNGAPSKISGLIACKAIEAAVKYCMQGPARSMVTAPVSKESFKLAGLKVPGHTEYLAQLTNSKNYCMMMMCSKINSVMVTRHLAVNKISCSLTAKEIISTVKTASAFISRFKKNPKTVICALNPHAGDNGILGLEEKEIIAPAVKSLKKAGFNVTGPLPADSAWMKTINGDFDLITAMYHDQIMIPLKVIAPEKIINVTAGLPFLRTSPGHGTAFDIAGTNTADESAMIESVIFAAERS